MKKNDSPGLTRGLESGSRVKLGKTMIALLLLTVFTTVSATELSATKTFRDEWYAAKNNSHSFIGQQWENIEGDKAHHVQHTLNKLFWRLELCKLLAALPEGEEKRWAQEFQLLIQRADLSIATANAMVQNTPDKGVFLYVSSKEEQPALYALSERLATTFKVPHPLITIADHPRMGTAWVVNNMGSNVSLLTIGSGLLDTVDDQGLEGILAHEFADVERNHPTQKGMMIIILSMLLSLLFLLALWYLAVYLKFIERTLYGFGLFFLFVAVCGVGDTIPKIVELIMPLHSRYIERDADRRACQLHQPAAAQLHRAFVAMKDQLDGVVAVRDKGYEKARNMIATDESLAEHVKKTLRAYIDGLESISVLDTAKRMSSHPPLTERIAALEKKLQTQG